MKKFLKQWRWTILIGIVVLVLGTLLRVYNLTLLPVFVDEAIYIRWSQIMVNEPTLRFLPLSDGKQPLFMWVLMFLVKRFSDPLFIGRLLSVASGVGTMVGIFTLSYLLFKSKMVSLTSAFIWAISPYSLFFDRMALVDPMLCMFGVATAIFGLLTVRYKRLDYALLTGLSLGFASLTKSPAVFFAVLLPVGWLIYFPKQSRLRYVLSACGLLSSTFILAFGMYNIQRLGPNFHLLTSRTEDYVFPISHAWTNFKDPFVFHIQEVFVDWLVKMGTWPILLAWLFSYLINWKKHSRQLLFLSAWFLIPTLVQSELAKVFTARYELYTLPFLFIMAASIFMQKKVKWQKYVSWGIFVLFTTTALFFDWKLLTNPEAANLPNSERSGYLEEWTAGTGIKEVADYLKSQVLNLKPDEVIVIGTEGYFGTLPDGLQMYLDNTTQVITIGVGLDFKELPQSLIESQESGNDTYLLVNKSRFKGDPDELGLELVAAYAKALRINEESREFRLKGPQEVLFFYKLTNKSI
ncbi:ArnT family glycosyltransferase [Patescibacteria group bacterium]